MLTVKQEGCKYHLFSVVGLFRLGNDPVLIGVRSEGLSTLLSHRLTKWRSDVTHGPLGWYSSTSCVTETKLQ